MREVVIVSAARTPIGSFQGALSSGNTPSVNDGAAALVVMSRRRAEGLGLEPLARIVGQATASLAPEWFTIAPADAIRKVLQKTGLTLQAIDLFELNEAFAVVALAMMQLLDLEEERVNIHGGTVALGHPIGCSGARILTTLLYAMAKQGAQRGLVSLCLGGGEAVAVVVERG